MLNLKILAIGRMKAGPEADLLEHYRTRALKAGRSLQFSGPEIFSFNESKKSSARQRKDEEANLIASAVKDGSMVISLDEHGKEWGSEQFAHQLADFRDNGLSELVFAIGGPEGHGMTILERTDRKLAFGSMTWPHQIARILLCEQIYRAFTILSGHPYHKS